MADEKKQKVKGKGSGAVIFIILLIIIILIVLFLLFGRGFGFGNGLGFGIPAGDGQSQGQQQNETAAQPETQPEQTSQTDEGQEYMTSVEVTVDGSSYIYKNSTVTLDDLISGLSETEGDFTVIITDSNSSKDAYDALTSALDEHGWKYSKAE